MRYARKPVLLVAMAIIATALAAAPASAGPVEVENTATETHCGTVSVADHVASGGCQLHFVGNGFLTLLRHVPGMGEVTILACESEYQWNVGETGEGWITNVSFTSGDAGCGLTFTSCTEPGGPTEPWHAHISHSGASEFVVMRLCLDVIIAPGVSCEIEGNFAAEIVNAGGNYSTEAENTNQGVPITARTITGAHGASHATCEAVASQIEFDGHWNFEAPDAIRITHL